MLEKRRGGGGGRLNFKSSLGHKVCWLIWGQSHSFFLKLAFFAELCEDKRSCVQYSNFLEERRGGGALSRDRERILLGSNSCLTQVALNA